LDAAGGAGAGVEPTTDRTGPGRRLLELGGVVTSHLARVELPPLRRAEAGGAAGVGRPKGPVLVEQGGQLGVPVDHQAGAGHVVEGGGDDGAARSDRDGQGVVAVPADAPRQVAPTDLPQPTEAERDGAHWSFSPGGLRLGWHW